MTFSSDPVVLLRNASIFQENQAVLNDISFELEKGELAFIIGRTGSGKSSLLRTMYADLPLRMGEMYVAEQDQAKGNTPAAQEAGDHIPGFPIIR